MSDARMIWPLLRRYAEWGARPLVCTLRRPAENIFRMTANGCGHGTGRRDADRSNRTVALPYRTNGADISSLLGFDFAAQEPFQFAREF